MSTAATPARDFVTAAGLTAPHFIVAGGDASENAPMSSISSRDYATASKPWHPHSISEVALPGDFVTVMDEVLKGVKLRVEQHGLCSLPASRTIVIFPSFSHSSHVASNADDPSPGWWQDYVGPDKPIDTRHWRVICISVLGSPFSPTNPTSIHPVRGVQYRTSFPQLTPTDLARCHAEVLRQMGFHVPPYNSGADAEAGTACQWPPSANDNGANAALSAPEVVVAAANEASSAFGSSSAASASGGHSCGDKKPEPLHAVVGSSLGGMQALQFASLFPDAVSRVISIASTGRTTPFTGGQQSGFYLSAQSQQRLSVYTPFCGTFMRFD